MSARAILSLALALFVLTFPAHAEVAEGPLEKLLKSAKGSLCYRRDYDAAHLERHPGQATQSVLLSYGKDLTTRIMLRQRSRNYYIVASCDFSERAAYDSSGNLVLKAFKGPAGYGCIVITALDSAQEGGSAMLDPAGGDGSTLTLHADSPVKARTKLDMNTRAIGLKLGSEDRQFHLTRTDQAACKAMDAKLKGL